MNIHELKGIDGTNPLGFLAAMGAFRVAALHDPNSKMAWETDVPAPYPILTTTLSQEFLAQAVCEEGSRILAKPKDSETIIKKIRKTKEERKKKYDELKDKRTKLRQTAKTKKMDKSDAHKWFETETAVLRGQTQQLETCLAKEQRALADILPEGSVYYGETIKVNVDVFRAVAQKVMEKNITPSLQMDMLAAFSSDAIVTAADEIQPSWLSFNNGASGKCLIKDAFDSAVLLDVEKVQRHLFEMCIPDDAVTGLGWNPSELSNYALQYANPAPKENQRASSATHNVMGFIGLSCFASMPTCAGEIRTIGFLRNDWYWGCWKASIGLDVLKSLLSILTDLGRDVGKQRAYGITCMYKATRIDPTGKGRKYFTPSMPM